ncbi:hypothetical protein Ocin01_01680 [Orchesella cincta]|uniref:Protein FAM177A1 n=1 Tax=Orchesella cincta TaxID=48709 RepID=A0A1D2NIB0_ORCCI|nr:hypothetical protein Ocin01_01680 [Orchesella cincta]
MSQVNISESDQGMQLQNMSSSKSAESKESVVKMPTKKVIHFADGSTLEDDDEEDGGFQSSEDKGKSSENPITKSVAHSTDTAAPVDTASMSWREWMRHQGSRAGTKTITVLEGMGGTAAYYLGITTPKYQSEIDEFNRMMTKKKAHDEELISWSSNPQNQAQPVVEDLKKNENGEILKQ